MSEEYEYIVMISSASMPSSVRAPYKNVALCKVIKGVRPKMISNRAKGMIKIVKYVGKLHAKGSNSAFNKVYDELQNYAGQLNAAIECGFGPYLDTHEKGLDTVYY